jgi:predicted nucleotide-binding protein
MKIETLFIDDDIFSIQSVIHDLSDKGFNVTICKGADAAMSCAKNRKFDLIISDIMMEPASFNFIETAGGFKTGLAICRKIREMQPEAMFVAYTLSKDPEVIKWFSQNEKFLIIHKGRESYESVADKILARIKKINNLPEIFIVHGHDSNSLLELKNYLQNTLKLGEPVILSEKPSKGKTIIEKFEYYSKDTDLVFVLFTPDDTLESGKKQARPNVIFELGYFLGKLGRHEGKVFLLHKSPTIIPTDLQGIIYVDISDGILKAGELIRNELQDIL